LTMLLLKGWYGLEDLLVSFKNVAFILGELA
jgi:hypothetical protein